MSARRHMYAFQTLHINAGNVVGGVYVSRNVPTARNPRAPKVHHEILRDLFTGASETGSVANLRCCFKANH